MAKRAVGEVWNCAACGVKLVGALTINGKVAPIEFDRSPDDSGNVFLFRRDGETRAATLAGPVLEHARKHGYELRFNHFATCPQKERFQPAGSRQETVRPDD